MRKGEATRNRIAARAAEVFNVRGVAGTSVADIMDATGHKKGGIYNHFESKEHLALAAFDHAAAVLARRFAPAWELGGLDSLRAFVETFRGYADHPPLVGGCPVLNTAIESDDGDPALRGRVRIVVDGWREHIREAVAVGQARGEIRDDVDGDELATLLIATMEGGLMLTRLYGDAAYLHRAAKDLDRRLAVQVRMAPP